MMLTTSLQTHDSGVFCRVANQVSHALGSLTAFGIALGIVIAWGVSGPLFAYSDTWQLVINTGTTIVTFLMVFLIQNTQNRDSAAIQLKLDEIIRSTQGAHNALLDLEKLSANDLEEIRHHYEHLAEKARRDKKGGWGDTGTPDVPSA
jgi:low affinity Fe/Cu permease